MGENTTFVRITNQMIYDEIVGLKNHVKITNGKVKVNTLRSSLALTGVIGLAGWIFFLLTKL